MHVVQAPGHADERLQDVGAFHFEVFLTPIGREVNDQTAVVIACFGGQAEAVERFSEAFGYG